MSDEQDTTAEEAVETDASQDIESPVVDATPDSDAQEAQDKVDKAEYEALQKELNKAKMEINLHRNKEKELELKNLEETGKYKEAYEKLQATLAEREEAEDKERQQREVEDLREKIISDYPEVADVAKDLNLWWDEAKDYTEAETQLRSKLDALKAKLAPSSEGDETSPEVHPNNPVTDVGGVDIRTLSAAQMRELLPKADPR